MSGKRRSIAKKNNEEIMSGHHKLLLCQLVTDALNIKEWDKLLAWTDISPKMKKYATEQIEICDHRIDENVNFLAASID